MRKTKVYSVRLQSLTSISNKCYKAKAFDGSELLIPKSQVFGSDFDVSKSDAYWIAAWFLEKENNSLQFTRKKAGWYNPSTRRVEPEIHYEVEKFVPKKVNPVDVVESLNQLSK